MTTTYTAFTPSPYAPFSFKPTLDGQVYQATVSWSLFGRRWYLSVTTLSGQLIFMKALTASPPNVDINLLFGYFKTSTMVFRASTQNFEVT